MFLTASMKSRSASLTSLTANTRGKEIGRGVGYDYPHDHPDGYVPQDYGVPRGTYYHPTDRGKEAEFKKRLQSFDEDDDAK